MYNHDELETAAINVELQPVIKRLNKDLRAAAKELPDREALVLVNSYYQAQFERIRTDARLRTIAADEPNLVLKFYSEQARTLEEYARIALDVYSLNHPVGQWLRAQKGIGPVLASAHLAFIDIEKAPYAGHIWSFAGLTPNGVRRRGEKSNFSPRYKKICWLTGESFVKVSGYEDAFYGQLYKEFRALEEKNNDNGKYAELAAKNLREKKFGEDTEAKKHYLEGRLPKAHLFARAKLRTVKVFLSHVHYKLYEHKFGQAPAMPYAIDILGHHDYIKPPV